jgi:hypothetical protein
MHAWVTVPVNDATIRPPKTSLKTEALPSGQIVTTLFGDVPNPHSGSGPLLLAYTNLRSSALQQNDPEIVLLNVTP